MPPRRGKLKLIGSSGGAISGGRRRLPCTYLQYMYGRFCAAAASQTPDREKGRDPPTSAAAAAPGTNNNNKHAPATAVKG